MFVTPAAAPLGSEDNAPNRFEFERIEIERELLKPGGYLDEIEKLKEELANIDRKLGVKLK